jgi:hypothetical protein
LASSRGKCKISCHSPMTGDCEFYSKRLSRIEANICFRYCQECI